MRRFGPQEKLLKGFTDVGAFVFKTRLRVKLVRNPLGYPGFPSDSNSVSSYLMPGSLKIRSIRSLVIFAVIVCAPYHVFSKFHSRDVYLNWVLAAKLAKEVAAPAPHFSKQLFNLLDGQRGWFRTAMLPTANGGERSTEFRREFFLSKTCSLSKFTNQLGNVCLTIQPLAPFRTIAGCYKLV
jgi:hypothetical protein